MSLSWRRLSGLEKIFEQHLYSDSESSTWTTSKVLLKFLEALFLDRLKTQVKNAESVSASKSQRRQGKFESAQECDLCLVTRAKRSTCYGVKL